MELTEQERQIWSREPAAVHIAAPRRVEGVADALRNAYLPRASELPAAMAALLAKLA